MQEKFQQTWIKYFFENQFGAQLDHKKIPTYTGPQTTFECANLIRNSFNFRLLIKRVIFSNHTCEVFFFQYSVLITFQINLKGVIYVVYWNKISWPTALLKTILFPCLKSQTLLNHRLKILIVVFQIASILLGPKGINDFFFCYFQLPKLGQEPKSAHVGCIKPLTY